MNQNVNLDLIPKFAVFGNLYFSQYDVGRTATINLLNGTEAYTIPVGATVKIQATKPSGLGFNETCTFSGNVVTVVSTETMTDEAGRIPCELRIEYNGDVLGTANFLFNVERSPHPEGTTDGTAESVLNDISVAFNHAMEQIENSGGLTPSIKNALLDCFAHVAWIDDQGQTYYDALVDAFYEVTGITLNFDSLLFNSIGSTQQLTATLIPSTSQALVTWESSDSSVASVSSSGLVTSVSDGNTTITASVGDVSDTCAVTVSIATVTSISAVLSGGTFYVGDPVDDIKPYLTVTATYSDSTTATVPSGSYTLSGSLSNVGANTITVSYEGVTTTVSVTAISAELVSISAVYTQSGTVYDTDSLDSLKSDLVVTATYSDSSTATVPSADYTLSGTLTEGTSTITVSYEGKTATFNVTVTEEPTREDIFGTFTNGYTCAKGTNPSSQSYGKVWRQVVSARATTNVPCVNKSYAFIVTDSSKYNIAVYDVTDNTPIETTWESAVDGAWYQGGSKSIAWAASDSASTPYIWIALKKMDNTAFTSAELANGAEAVFTYIVNLYVKTSTQQFAAGDLSSTYYASMYIPITGGETYIVTKTASNQFRVATSIDEPADGVSYLQTDANHTGTSITITTDPTANYLFVVYWYNSGDYDEQTIRNSLSIRKAS